MNIIMNLREFWERNNRSKKKKVQPSRKEQRKQQRVEKKQRKSTYFSKTLQNEIPAILPAQKRSNDEPDSPRKRQKVNDAIVDRPTKKETVVKQKAPKNPINLDLDPSLLIDSIPEDAEIARLANLLGFKGKKKKAAKAMDS